jgi:hypothetical protein
MEVNRKRSGRHAEGGGNATIPWLCEWAQGFVPGFNLAMIKYLPRKTNSLAYNAAFISGQILAVDGSSVYH